MRVSTAEQNLALQRDALQRMGCERLYEDVCSGAVTDRPGLTKALDQLRAGDALVVWKLDRIGRSLGHVVELVGGLQAKGIGLKVLTGGIDTTSSTGRLVFGGPVAAEPKLHFGAILLQKGIDHENAAVPKARSYPNCTEEVFHANVPQGFTSMGL